MKIATILYLKPPTSVKQMCMMLGHTGYNKKFIKGYAHIMTTMEKLLKKDTNFQWTDDCQKGFEILKTMLVIASILIFSDWNKDFHVHMDA